MSLVLDTCALVALAEGERMRASARAALREAQEAQQLVVPSYVALEIAQKMNTGKLAFGDDSARRWFARAMTLFGPAVADLDTVIALAAYELPGTFHRDPADRVIVATARLLDAAVVTVDERILAYGRQGHVDTLDY